MLCQYKCLLHITEKKYLVFKSVSKIHAGPFEKFIEKNGSEDGHNPEGWKSCDYKEHALHSVILSGIIFFHKRHYSPENQGEIYKVHGIRNKTDVCEWSVDNPRTRFELGKKGENEKNWNRIQGKGKDALVKSKTVHFHNSGELYAG